MDYYNLVLKLGRIYGSIPGCMPPVNDYALPPLFLVLELTYRCNLACPYCYLRPAANRGSSVRELTAAEIEHIIGRTPPWTLILLSGGEILIRDDLEQILQKLARKRRCHIFTNGTLITPADARQWVKFGLASVGVSVDGPEKIHDAMRGPGTFSRAISAIKMIVAARRHEGKPFPLINLKTTITAENAANLAEIVHLAEETEADYCTFQILNRTTRLGGSALEDCLEYNLEPPRFADFPLRVLSDQLQRIREAPPTRVRVRILPDLPIPSILDHYANRLDPRKYGCISPWTVTYVSPYGDVYPCLNYRVGNLREKSLRKLWNCRRYRQFRRKLVREGLFQDCGGCCDLLRGRPIFWRDPAIGPANESG